MICHARLPSSLQEFLKKVVALARDGKTSRRGLPTSYGALLEAAAIAHRHRAMVTLLFSPMPPPFSQRLLFRCSSDSPKAARHQASPVGLRRTYQAARAELYQLTSRR
jgi:hypothetical protein